MSCETEDVGLSEKKGVWSEAEDFLLLALVNTQLSQMNMDIQRLRATAVTTSSSTTTDASVLTALSGNALWNETSVPLKLAVQHDSSKTEEEEVGFRSAKELETESVGTAGPSSEKGMRRSISLNRLWNDERKQWRIDWVRVSTGMKGRSGKQCRERWINHLDPNLTRKKWSSLEDERLLELAEAHPKKWAFISRELPGRSQNQVKIRWNTLTKTTRKRKINCCLESAPEVLFSSKPTPTLPLLPLNQFGFLNSLAGLNFLPVPPPLFSDVQPTPVVDTLPLHYLQLQLLNALSANHNGVENQFLRRN